MDAREGWAAAVGRYTQSPLLRDLALITLIVASMLAALAAGSTPLGDSLTTPDVVAAILAVLLVLLGHRVPTVALGLCAVATALTVSDGGEKAGLVAATVILLFRVASQTNRRTAVIVAGATVALYGVTIAFLEGLAMDRDSDILIWAVVAVAVGDAVRSHRAYLAEVEERVLRAEQSREEEARRRVAEERLRIARELHDLVAHRMAVINVQAGVASHLLRSQPEQSEGAEQALRIVRESVSEVLEELGEMLGVLRNVDDPEAPVEPTPTLRELGALVESFALAGLEVHWTSSGTLEGMPDSVQLAVFRLVQEGLTNAQRYGDGHASLRVERSPATVDVTIANRIVADAGPAAGSGFGLLGMRERVAAVGGTLETGPTGNGWFTVAAHVPAPARAPV